MRREKNNSKSSTKKNKKRYTVADPRAVNSLGPKEMLVRKAGGSMLT